MFSSLKDRGERVGHARLWRASCSFFLSSSSWGRHSSGQKQVPNNTRRRSEEGGKVTGDTRTDLLAALETLEERAVVGEDVGRFLG